jgi:DNA-directed RNA polymerase specialized sigma subunit
MTKVKKQLNKTKKMQIRFLYKDGFTQEEIGNIFKITKARVNQVVNEKLKILDKLKQWIYNIIEG